MARRSDGESALAKHLRVLEAFDALEPFLTLAEIADAAGLARSTAHRLVGELVREGLLERMPDRTYRLGIRLWEFASRTPGALGLRELARPFMEAVHARIGQHTQLGVLSGTDVLFVERLSRPDAVINATLIGGRTPLPLSSSGLVLLAHAGDETVERVIVAGWPHPTPRTPRGGDELQACIRRARSQGVAVTDGYIHEASRGVAVPVFGPQGAVYAALGIVIPNDARTPSAEIELLTFAAAGITRALRDAYAPGDGTAATAGQRLAPPLAGTSRASRVYYAELDAAHDPRGREARHRDPRARRPPRE
ncbi:IclR family transcriptional regulator [Pseudoclavibacter endophyticus]|uniref:Glycerol operon regulatory protein n=1 Tax=Pseudoclavibacter endophyticus TaxID=1778590 RepID=A0A6H9WQM1_9MICO|nr:IclR family transcriptional regulator [Pseudoclavibacter endophyticus]KAB1649085.1 IclR family transcriptional regulator [Pseudoclavibacter endophyticus]GGA65579.1 IclR family transcriptional regulator [Pseudoclavibacter endophyticus]